MSKYCKVKSKFNRALEIIAILAGVLSLAWILWWAVPILIGFDVNATVGYLTNPSGSSIAGLNGSPLPRSIAFVVDAIMSEFLLYAMYCAAIFVIALLSIEVLHVTSWERFKSSFAKTNAPPGIGDKLFFYPMRLVGISLVARIVTYSGLSLYIMYGSGISIFWWLVGLAVLVAFIAYAAIWILCEMEKSEEKKLQLN